MMSSEDGVLKTIKEHHVIMRNWVLFQIGWSRNVLFEWMTFKWVAETHKGDKWRGWGNIPSSETEGRDSDRSTLGVLQESKPVTPPVRGPWNTCLCFALCCCLSSSCPEISTAVTSGGAL